MPEDDSSQPHDMPLPQDAAAPLPPRPRSGCGVVARLPKQLRNEIGLMMDDNVPYAEIANRIHEKAPTVSSEHVRDWKRYGGFDKWRSDEERIEDLCSAREAALDLVQTKAGDPTQDAGRTIVAAQLYELILSFNPSQFAKTLANKPELYLRLVNALSRLSEGDALCFHRRLQKTLTESKLQAGTTDAQANLPTLQEIKDLARRMKLL